MNRFTKKSLIFCILAVAVILVGILVFCIAADQITDSYSTPPETDDPGASLGRLIAALAGMAVIFVIAIADLVFSSLFVYIFAYFSHENALAAINELTEKGESLKLPKFLRVISVIEMVLSSIAALLALLLFAAIFVFI